MATKKKKIETRIEPDDYLILKNIADKSEMSVYGIVQDFIHAGIKDCTEYDGARAITVFANNEMYDKLSELADEHDTTVQNAAWNCIRAYLKRLEKKRESNE